MRNKGLIHFCTAIVFIGFFFVIYKGIEALYEHNEPLGISYLAFGFGLLGILVGIISMVISDEALGITKESKVISEESKKIANESDEKMKSIATGDFYDLTNRFWDRAPFLYDCKIKEARDTQSWQLGNLFRQAEKIKKWAEPDVQDRLIKEFKTFLERLRDTSCKKYWVEVKNYRSICNTAIGFNTDNDEMKNKLIDELGKWIGEKKEGESNKQYLKRKMNEISDKKKFEVFP